LNPNDFPRRQLMSKSLKASISLFAAALLVSAIASPVRAQTTDAGHVAPLAWRMIGPHRAGRTVGATGVRQQPNVFYIGVNNGGVWKTTDYGRTWFPIFDDQPTSSIGDIVVAPSDPNVIYVGTGEGLQRPDLSMGDGVYKSTDAGKTWRHLPGLRDAQQLGGLAVDPRDSKRVFVAALGHPYGPNTERGVYRSLDGGETWERVLYKDENTGAIQVTLDPNNPDVVYADLWAGRQGPWENATWDGPLSGLYKSTNGGTTWTQLTGGLPSPAEGLGRIGFGIAPSDSRRLYATVDAGNLGGIYRSDDAGATWYRTNPDGRLWGRGSDFAEIKVDPRNSDVVYSANVVTWKSTDGAKTWTALKGAPGGDDYHRIWINPDNPDIMLLGVDQGGTLTVNGGQTWSSWYNQPTAQFYHVITDNRIPYRVYGSQQESGSVGITSRGDYGQITFADWNPVGSEEYGYVAPDPLDPNIIYGGKISRFDQRTREVQNISPAPGRGGKYRFIRTAPIIFSHVDPHVLYFAGNVLFKTTNGGHSWDVISPDLTRVDYDVPASYGMYTGGDLSRAKNRGVIYSIGPSFKDVNTIWTGSDDGYIQLTRDGGATWKNVTPASMTPWSKVAQIEASHFDDATAYAAVNRMKLDDLRPHIYRTHDGGATWQETVSGIPGGEIVNAVREDPLRKGLLFAGTERAVYYSLDDGDHWQSLRLNMPATSIRDLVLHDDDIVVGTHGRSFWILDDYSPIRQMGAAVDAGNAYLFKPKLTYRFRRDKWTDTPLPPEEPAGTNPPDGAIITYTLKSAPKFPVKLEIVDAGGRVVRAFASNDPVKPIVTDLGQTPLYWIRQPQPLAASASTHRFVWDLHWPPPDVSDFSYPISAVPHDTPPYPLGPAAMSGEYTIRLTVDGKTYTQPLTVRMDPRSRMTADALRQQFDYSVRAWEGIHKASGALREVQALRARIRALRDTSVAARAGKPKGATPNVATESIDSLAAGFEGGGGRFGGGGASAAPTFGGISGTLSSLLDDFEGADKMPTTQAVAALNQALADLDTILARWNTVKGMDK
jgi:photosystem II stability/assembly factor-like uncharacterized protein